MSNPQYEMTSIGEREERSMSPIALVPSAENGENGILEGEHLANPPSWEHSSISGNTPDVQASERTLNEFYHSPSQSLHDEELPTYLDASATSQHNTQRLERNLTGFYLAFLFSTLVLVQWVILVHICHRPFGSGKSYEVTGRTQQYDFARNEKALKAVTAIGTICSLFVIIVVSTVLSRAAVLLTQRRNSKPGYTTSQILPIADEVWLSLPIIFKSMKNKNLMSPYLFYGFSLCVSAVLIYPIQQNFLQIHDVNVPTYNVIDTDETNGSGYSDDEWPQGNTEPALYELSATGGYVSALSNALISTGPFDAQLNLWNTSKTFDGGVLWTDTVSNIASGLQEQLASPLTSWYAIQNNTYNNGIYEAAGLRMNTSVACDLISESDYPTICPGDVPWNISISLNSTNDTMLAATTDPRSVMLFSSLNLRVCVPGNQFLYPWDVQQTLQTIQEELYLDINWNRHDQLDHLEILQNSTQRCTVNTTSGYFDLPNYTNGTGPLLSADVAIPGATEMEPLYRICNTSSCLNDNSLSALSQVQTSYHGPLLTSALASFVDWSDYVDEYGGVDPRLNIQWPLNKFIGGNMANEQVFRHSMMCEIANALEEPTQRISVATKSAWELVASTGESYRPIYTDLGRVVRRPYIPLPVIVIVSILVAYLTLSLFFLGVRSVHVTWTAATLDSLSMIILTREAADKIPRSVFVLHPSTGYRKELSDVLADSPSIIGDAVPQDKVGVLAVGSKGTIGIVKSGAPILERRYRGTTVRYSNQLDRSS